MARRDVQKMIRFYPYEAAAIAKAADDAGISEAAFMVAAIRAAAGLPIFETNATLEQIRSRGHELDQTAQRGRAKPSLLAILALWGLLVLGGALLLAALPSCGDTPPTGPDAGQLGERPLYETEPRPGPPDAGHGDAGPSGGDRAPL